MPPALRSLLRIALGAAVAWQAAAAGAAIAQRFEASGAADWDDRLTADTATRVRRFLGGDADILLVLRELVPAHTVVCNRQVQGSLEELVRTARSEDELRATIDRLSARNGLFVQMTALLFPDVVFWSVPDPIGMVESDPEARSWLFVLDGDAEPTDRAGWTCAHRSDRFRLWRFRKG
jgi:hypothetical protein